MKTHIPAYLLIGMIAISCSSETQVTGEEQRAIKDAKEILSNLPELKEEIEEHEDALTARTLEGTFSGTIDGEPFAFSSWDARNSAITLYDHVANLHGVISKGPLENMSVKLFAQNWWEKSVPATLPASVFEMKDNEYLEVLYWKENGNGDRVHEFRTANGTLTLKAWTKESLKLSFDGEGFMGDFRLQKKVPLTFELELDYNFVTADLRKLTAENEAL